jgi:hypothetical protein
MPAGEESSKAAATNPSLTQTTIYIILDTVIRSADIDYNGGTIRSRITPPLISFQLPVSFCILLQDHILSQYILTLYFTAHCNWFSLQALFQAVCLNMHTFRS